MEIIWEPLGIRSEANADENLLTAARRIGIRLPAFCGGMRGCGACKIILLSGNVTAVTVEEYQLLTKDELACGTRLACCTRPLGSLRIRIPHESLEQAQRLQLESSSVPQTWQRGTGYGLAVDIGTTKIAAYLIDMTDGRCLASEGCINPQADHGEDVISRIAFADTVTDGGRLLQQELIEAINKLTVNLCFRAGISPRQVKKAVFVCNTAIHHFLLGLPTTQLGIYPFVPAETSVQSPSPRTLGLLISEEAQIFIPGIVDGFIGADHLAMLIGCNADLGEKNRLAIDIGTNTEVSLFTKGGTAYCCSCASGPAFEGRHIRCGMRAAGGAIERAKFIDGKLCLMTIGSSEPLGFCGSGILDMISALKSAGGFDDYGRFDPNFPDMENDVYRISPKVYLTPADVNEVLLAKGAIRTGIEILLHRAEMNVADLNEVIIAGAFGTYLNLDSAINIGMFPKLPSKIFRQVGNAAGLGACLLLQPNTCSRVEALAARLQFTDLVSNPDFSRLFIESLKL